MFKLHTWADDQDTSVIASYTEDQDTSVIASYTEAGKLSLESIDTLDGVQRKLQRPEL